MSAHLPHPSSAPTNTVVNITTPKTSQKSASFPIGVFDSGIGGTTTLHTLQELLPHEHFIYIADTAHNPYGEKSQKELESIVTDVCDSLIFDHHVKMIVVACNTATTRCISFLRGKYPDIPFVGTEPAVKLACDSGGRHILVMATPATIESERLSQLVKENQQTDQHITLLPCPGLASAIESRDTSRITSTLESLLGSHIGTPHDTIVLGCTHYIIIKDQIQRLFPSARLLDGNAGIAKRVQNIIKDLRP